MKTLLFATWLGISWSGLAWADVAMEPETALSPEIEFVAKDAGMVRDMLQENPWMQTFQQSNLFRGLMIQSGPVFNAIGSNFKDAWQGKLIDFTFDEIMRGRPAVLRLFQRRALVSPFVLTVRNIGGGEQSVVEATAKLIKGGEPHILALQEDLTPAEEEEGKEPETLYTATIGPVKINSQRFAVVLDEGCLRLGRDPVATASAAHLCRNEQKPLQGDAELNVRLQTSFPAVYVFAEKFLGIGRQWQANFKWNAGKKRFEPATANMQLTADHLFGADNFKDVVDVLPATTEFAAVMAAPVPERLEPGAVAAFLGQSKQALKGAPRRKVVVANLGPAIGDESIDQVVVLVDWPKPVDAQTIQEAAFLFSGPSSTGAYVRGVCRNWLAITPSSRVLNRIEAVCQRKAPALADAPAAAKVFNGAGRSLATYFNLGGFLSQTLVYGVETAGDSDKNYKEVGEARDMLAQLPILAAYGKVEGKQLKMTGVMQ